MFIKDLIEQAFSSQSVTVTHILVICKVLISVIISIDRCCPLNGIMVPEVSRLSYEDHTNSFLCVSQQHDERWCSCLTTGTRTHRLIWVNCNRVICLTAINPSCSLISGVSFLWLKGDKLQRRNEVDIDTINLPSIFRGVIWCACRPFTPPAWLSLLYLQVRSHQSSAAARGEGTIS